MAFNLTDKTSFSYVSDENMMLSKVDVEGGVHDSVEWTYQSYCAYRKNILIDGVKKCLSARPPRRYPKKYAGMKPMSRDHCINGLAAIMEYGASVGELKLYMPPIIFDKGKGSYMNLQMWLWTKLITDKKIGKLFYLVALLQAVKNSLWNQMLNRLFRYSNKERDVEVYNEFIYLHNKKKASLYYPVYAIKLVATMLQYTRKNWFSKQIKKQLLKITPEKNFALKIMLGDKYVTEDDVVNFRPINKPRWSQMINPMRNNRTFRYLTEEEMAFNCVDKDYLMYLWNNRENFYE